MATGTPFEQFYEAYPLKTGERDAQTEYSRAITRGTVQSILDGAKRYAQSCRGKETRFIASPAKWLAGDRWKDQPPMVQDTSRGRFTFPAEKRLTPRTPSLNWAQVLVRRDLPQYAKMVERAANPRTDQREYLFTVDGIKVVRGWLGHDSLAGQNAAR